MIQSMVLRGRRDNLYIVRSFPFYRMEKRGKEVVFFFVVVVIMLSYGAEATHQSVTVTLEPADSDPIFVGETFNVNVMLNVPAETTNSRLYSALLKFVEGPRADFQSSGLLTSNIFDPLEQNAISFGLWVMDGDGGGRPFTLTTTPQRLGTIPLKALQVGQLDVALSGKAGANVLEQSSGVGKIPAHYYTISPLVVNVNIRDHVCGDGIVSGTESESTCCIDTGCSTATDICSTTATLPGGQCLADIDGDTIPDVDETLACRGTPSGYAVFTSGGLRGCLIGDIDADGDIDSDDIATFISVYNARGSGTPPGAADLDQNTNLDSDDIAKFIFHYNRRP